MVFILVTGTMEEQKNYSLIVIGAGMAGLSTALAWAETHDLKKDPVLVLEKEPAVGGCVTTFARGGYHFDTVQIIPDISDLQKFFNLSFDLIPYTNCYARLFLANPAHEKTTVISIPADRQAFEGMLMARYPREAVRIRRFFRYGQAMLDELVHLKTEPTLRDGLEILLRCPKIIRQSFRTYKRYLESFHFKNQELIEILDLFSSFSALSGNRCAALLTACAMLTTLQGSYRPRGGFIQFPNSLLKVLIQRGGQVKTATRVDRILCENGRVKGVRCGDSVYNSENVVCTADTQKTVEKLLETGACFQKRPSGNLGNWYKKYLRTRPSPSSFTIHLGLDEEIDLAALGFGCGYNVLTTGRMSHEKAFDAWERGQLMRETQDFHLAVISPSAAIGGKATLIIHVTPAPPGDWEEVRNRDYHEYLYRKNETAQYYIDLVEKYMVPHIRCHIKLVDIATPATYARYLGSTDGANNSMLSVPSNFGMFRLPTRTPVAGLFLPKFSHGIWPSLQAGLQVVDMMTGGAIMKGHSRYIPPE